MTYLYQGEHHPTRKALLMWIRHNQVEYPISCQSEEDGKARAARKYGDYEIIDIQTQEEFFDNPF